MERDFSSGVPLSELTDHEMIAGRLGEEGVLLVRDSTAVHAVGATCPHYGAPLVDGSVVDGTVRCSWHHASFDLRTGAVLRAPALTGLPCWQVEQRGDRVFIGERIDASVPSSPGGPRSVVIIGAGSAGVNVADTLRREGYAGQIILISEEDDLPYDKPNLSKDFLAGHAAPEWLPLHPLEYYEEEQIELRLGVRVASLDLTTKHVVTASGERVPFDALVLAMGATVRRLEVPGAEIVRYLRTRRDAERLVLQAGSARDAIVIGSGFIGLETAASLRQKGLNVVVVSPDRLPLERILGPQVGARIREIHEGHGVTFRLGRSVASVDAAGVVLDDGDRISGDLIVAGVGVSPATELARAAAIDTANGIVVNEYLETSVPGVFACGDLASWPDRRSKERIRVEHWVVAGRQGQTVARNILGRAEIFDAVPFFWSAHFDVTIGYVGHGAGWETADVSGLLEENAAIVTYRRGVDVLAVATIGRDTVSLAAEHAMERSDWAGLQRLLGGADPGSAL